MLPQNSRFEIKYLVHAPTKAALMHDVAAMTRADNYAGVRGGSYVVRSLYLDSPQSKAYYEKTGGILKRSKYRIRTYNGYPSVRFLEIKERLSNRIAKLKERIDSEQYQAIISRRHLPGFQNSAVLRRFWHDAVMTALRPVLIIQYKRQPLVGAADLDLRVTFDSEMRVSRARNLEKQNSLYTVLPAGYAILEIKFNRYLPRWIQELARKYSLTDIPCSKFCLGLEELSRRGVVHLA